ncbi:MAG TPA: FkbM family methyltransferase [Thermoanaerobaculia bacterium]|nr:FkbM family methyltransferase [Thermoanaerobaculia bacterium]
MTSRRDLRTWIAEHRDNPILSAAARVSAKYLRAYENQVQWDVHTNGEAFALEQVVRAAAGDVFDVGANAGSWALMAARVAPERRIHSFELSDRTFARLRSAVASNPRIIANPFGLGERPEDVTFQYYPDSDDRSSLVVVPDGFDKQQATGRLETGDGYVSGHGVERIAYLKIDVEGAEMSVLRGFHESFERGIVAAVQFEHGPAHVVTRHLLIDFVEFFERIGFAVCRMFPRRLEWLRYDPVQHENFTGSNFLAVRADVSRALFG